MSEVLVNNELAEYQVEWGSDDHFSMTINNKKIEGRFISYLDGIVLCRLGDRLVRFPSFNGHSKISGKNIYVENKRRQSSGGSASPSATKSPMPGKILKILFKEGDLVQAGEALIIMEAMKMEHSIKAPKDSKVVAFHCSEGGLVDGGIELVELEETHE